MFRNQETFRRGKTSKNWKFELMRWLKRKKVQASQPDFKPWEPHSCPLTSTGPWYIYIYICILSYTHTHKYINVIFEKILMTTWSWQSYLFDSKRLRVYLEKGKLIIKSYMGKGTKIIKYTLQTSHIQVFATVSIYTSMYTN